MLEDKLHVLPCYTESENATAIDVCDYRSDSLQSPGVWEHTPSETFGILGNMAKDLIHVSVARWLTLICNWDS